LNREWRDMEEFPKYQISNFGEFVNARTDREVRHSQTPQGHAKVTLVKDGRQTTRGVSLLVAKTFLPQPAPHFDTPIHLDGDFMNCRVDNLMWRPRWFAIRFHRQFQYEQFHQDLVKRIDLQTGEIYESLKDVCCTNGLYYQDVYQSEIEGTFTFPTGQEFQTL
jgi:hypothetical protein